MTTKTNRTWTLRDAMRLSHPKGVDPAVGNFILRGEVSSTAPAIIHGFQAAQAAKTENEVLRVLEEYPDLPWETIPTEFHKSLKVWRKIFDNGALRGQALVRNVTRFARLKAFDDLSFAAEYAGRLTDEEEIRRGRLHPMNYLNALLVHQRGQKRRDNLYYWGESYNKDWDTSSIIADALEEGFYRSFKYVEPANKATLLAIDVSASMNTFNAAGLDMTSSEVSAAMAMTIARTEPAYEIRGFDRGLVDLGITAKTSLSDALAKTRGFNGGGTDCAVPMLWALENRKKFDTFVVLTDNDTWSGRTKPHQALTQYQNGMNIPAKMIVVAASSLNYTIADPSRPHEMMDIAGADSNLPKVVTEFSAGRI